MGEAICKGQLVIGQGTLTTRNYINEELHQRGYPYGTDR